MTNKITKKPFLGVGYVGGTELSDKFKDSSLRFTQLTFLFFLFGYVFDSINYIRLEYWTMLSSNIVVISILGITLPLFQYKKKNIDILYLLCYIVLTLDSIFNMWGYILQDLDIAYHTIRITMVTYFVLLGASFHLSRAWATTLACMFVVNFIVCVFYSQEPYLFDSILVIPLILCGITYWVNYIKKLHLQALSTTIEYKEQNEKLTKMLNTDTQQMRKKIEHLYNQSQERNLNLEDEIKSIAKIAEYNLPDLMDKHTEQITSDENLFVNKILKQHPTLTAGELKLAYMLVRNMSTKDIMIATNKAESTVKVYRHRLRKKMQVQPRVSLMQYLKQYEY